MKIFADIRLPKKSTIMITLTALIVAIAGIWAGFGKEKIDSIPTIAKASDDLVIILDAGHGGMDGGCSSADGVSEKGINLNILLNLRDMLKMAGYTVEVTRDTDRSIHDDGVTGIANQKSSDMDNRLALFNKYDNAICISIHQNQFTNPIYSGAQMFYSDNVAESGQLAQLIQDKFVENIQADNMREIKLCGKELFLCYYSKNPTVMVECGFLSNVDEANLLKSEEYQKKIAFTIFSALNQYITNKK